MLKGHEVINLLNKAQGWFSPKEAICLIKSMEMVPRGGSWLEIGSFKGRSLIVLACHAKKYGAKVYSVDPHYGAGKEKVFTAPILAQNLKDSGYFEEVTTIKATSEAASKFMRINPITLMHIDGNHDHALKDFDWWKPQLEKGAIVAFHDYGSFPLVNRDIDILLERGEIEKVDLAGSLWIGRLS